MKSVTLVAMIGVILEVLAGLYFSLVRLELFHYNPVLGDIMSSMYFFGSITLLIFFIRLYQKQSE
jgi:hypothetical protein